jgi:hypothetical protein
MDPNRERAAGRIRGATLGLALLGGLASPLLAASPQAQQNWSRDFGGEYYYDHAVSIGLHGSEVFVDSGYPEQYTRLFSSNAGTGAADAWTRQDSGYALNRSVGSAELAGVHAFVRQEQSGGTRARLRAFRSTSTTPVADFVFASTSLGAGSNFCAVSDDGRFVVGATTRSQGLQVVRLDLESSSPSTPSYSEVLDPFGPEQVFAASADGRRFYVGGVYTGTVIDLLTGARLFEYQYPFGAAERGHSLSADGRTLVVPVAGKIHAYRDQGAGYQLAGAWDPFPTTSGEVPYCTAASADGRVVAAAYAVSPDFLKVHLHAWDRDTGQQLLAHTVTGAGAWNNLPTDLALSGSGERLVLSVLGDQAGLADEVQVFERLAPGGPFSPGIALDLPGSVYRIDLSRSGEHLALSRRAGHAASPNSTKLVETYDLGSDLRLSGQPLPGGQVVASYLTSGAAQPALAYLLVATQPAPSPEVFPFGTLHVRRQGVTLVPMQDADGDGTFEAPVPLAAGALGVPTYLQGYSVGPRRLSDSWRVVTPLP